MTEFFRSCTGCGHRFRVKLVAERLVRQEGQPRPTIVTAKVGGARGGAISNAMVQHGKPVILLTREFEYSYRCNSCVHEWAEKQIREEREG